MNDALTIWTVFKHPSDYPDKWVLRADVVIPGGVMRRPFIEVAETLEEIRAKVPPMLFRMPRDPDDDPAIFEVWL